MTDARLAAARARRDVASAALTTTLAELQYRLKPSTIAGEAKDAIRRRSGEIAEDAVEIVSRRPIAASAAVAGVGALLGAGLFARWRRKDRETL